MEGPAPISDPEAGSSDDGVSRPPLRGGPRDRRTLGNRGYHNAQRAPLNGHKYGRNPVTWSEDLAREEEEKLMSQRKQLMDAPCETCPKGEYQCYVENERIKVFGRS
ncbi:hypothetical protein IW261DRAFT_1571327 [Armillaria novae-zelandiae]|uniref:Uncharacterized protein n=1 Tax=Armillaria novae-zelandiae TaxID=153914 RepID=A0AA39UAZ3_9AGAR|nr:hypothetical protein IW261DRAFT_1571327 [Armillaria novae-zelandiae]